MATQPYGEPHRAAPQRSPLHPHGDLAPLPVPGLFTASLPTQRLSHCRFSADYKVQGAGGKLEHRKVRHQSEMTDDGEMVGPRGRRNPTQAWPSFKLLCRASQRRPWGDTRETVTGPRPASWPPLMPVRVNSTFFFPFKIRCCRVNYEPPTFNRFTFHVLTVDTVV